MDITMNTQHDQPTTPTVINSGAVNKAVTIGQTAIADGKTKADAVRLMFPHVFTEQPEVIWQTFVDGAGLTAKGAVTYWYNVRREHKKGKLKVALNDQP